MSVAKGIDHGLPSWASPLLLGVQWSEESVSRSQLISREKYTVKQKRVALRVVLVVTCCIVALVDLAVIPTASRQLSLSPLSLSLSSVPFGTLPCFSSVIPAQQLRPLHVQDCPNYAAFLEKPDHKAWLCTMRISSVTSAS
eukprot:2250707-Amphidinium_carterae.1